MTRPQHAPRPTLDLDAVRTHLRDARARRVSTALWTAIADVPVLIAEIDRLRTLLALARGQYANLLAAARAALAADQDGENDPLGYLRDEVDTYGQLPDRYAPGFRPVPGLEDGGR
jgi:hypothetical protein